MPMQRLVVDQRVRFLMVGGTNTIVGYCAFAFFDLFVFQRVPQGHLLSLVMAYAVSISLAFFLYRRFVFRVKGKVWRDFGAFVSVNMFAIALNLVLLALLVDVVGLPALAGQAIALAITVVVSYLGHREVSFRR